MRPPDNMRAAPVILGIAAVTALAWFIATGAGLQGGAIDLGAFVPAFVGSEPSFERLPAWLTPLSATLIHGDILHLLFNLLMLVFCGRSVEPVLGRAGVAMLYLIGAYAAAAGQYLASPSSMVPMIGASGAISAVIGAYAMLFGRNKVKVANPTLALWLHALWLMAAWVILQAVIGAVFNSAEFGIAVAAHVGGFIPGVLLARPLLLFRYRKA